MFKYRTLKAVKVVRSFFKSGNNPNVQEWINKFWYIYAMENYLTLIKYKVDAIWI